MGVCAHMKSAFLSLLMVSTIALIAQPENGNAAGDPVASVQSGGWFETSTWDCACVPGVANDISILAGHAVDVNANDTAHAQSLAVAEGAVLALMTGSRLELSASLAALGEIAGSGMVALVGDGNHVCGPAKLNHLDCGTSSVNFTDTVFITGQLDLHAAELETGNLLVLEGTSGITNVTGTIAGQVMRRYAWEKQSPYTYHVGTGLGGVEAAQLLDVPGTVYLKQWLEPTSGYLTLVESDVLGEAAGFNCSLSAGMHEFELTGSAVLEADLDLTSEASSNWQGWNLLANPMTGFVDLKAVTVTGEGTLGATYEWVDSLNTYSVQVAGLGTFGNTGVVAPGRGFWTIADANSTVHFGAEALVGKKEWEAQHEHLSAQVLGLQLSVEDRIDQCIIEFGTGSASYDRLEDAEFLPSGFRGRNHLDLFSKSDDDVSLAVNRTHGEAQVLPIWVKGLNGDSVTIRATNLPESRCLILEDLETGWTGSVDADMEYTFFLNTSLDQHRFNLVFSGGVEVSSTEAACASALDGTVFVAGPDLTVGYALNDAEGNAVGTFVADSIGGTFINVGMGTYTVTAMTEGCADISKTVEVEADPLGSGDFEVDAILDHIGCYDDHGGVSLDIEGGLEPYTVAWTHGALGASIEVDEAGMLEAVITDGAGCSDTTHVEVLQAPQVQAGIDVDQAVVTLVDGEAEVYFNNTSEGATAYQWNFGDGGSSFSDNPTHAYEAAGSYTVGLNAWNDYCSDTYQMVVTVETVSSVGQTVTALEVAIERTFMGWEITHPHEAFQVEVFDLTGRIVHRTSGLPGDPVVLDPAEMPSVALVHWVGAQSGQQKTWRLGR